MKNLFQKIEVLICAAVLLLSCAGCGGKQPVSTSAVPGSLPVIGPDSTLPEESTKEQPSADTKEPGSLPDPSQSVQESETGTEEATEPPTESEGGHSEAYPTAYNTSARITYGTNGYIICIDAGHQEKANSEKEAIGPGASETKAKVSSGTKGRWTEVPEYKVTLEVSLLLEKELAERGYTVLMVRTTHDVNISNVERASLANEINADAFIRIHCNGTDSETVQGCGAVCQSKSNPYVGDMYSTNFSLNNNIVNSICELTGQAKYGVIAEDNMAGINWCRVPAALIELGFMTNEAEDHLLVSEDYQKLAAKGIANGIDKWLTVHGAEAASGQTAEAVQTTAAEESTSVPATEAEETATVPAAETAAPSPSRDMPDNAVNYVTAGTNGYIIAIDPGHQAKANSEQEPVGPGASETKAKVSSGTASRFNGKAEYLVNLEVAVKLREVLLDRGYTVIMTRTGHDVNVSNIERAEMANNAKADAFVRIHCNGSDNAAVNGIGIYYQTPGNPYNGALHDAAKALNACLISHMLEKTGARNDGLIESDIYSGINWCKVPAGLVEIGYMTNQEEDAKLQDPNYQMKLAVGMADGIDEYLRNRK